jgi:hypothetical protein
MLGDGGENLELFEKHNELEYFFRCGVNGYGNANGVPTPEDDSFTRNPSKTLFLYRCRQTLTSILTHSSSAEHGSLTKFRTAGQVFRSRSRDLLLLQIMKTLFQKFIRHGDRGRGKFGCRNNGRWLFVCGESALKAGAAFFPTH